MPLTRLAALAGTARGRRLASGLLIAALGLLLAATAACGPGDDSPQRPVYPDASQRRVATLPNPTWRVAPSLTEQIVRSTTIVRATLQSAAAAVVAEPDGGGYRPVQELRFTTHEYLKGTGRRRCWWRCGAARPTVPRPTRARPPPRRWRDGSRPGTRARGAVPAHGPSHLRAGWDWGDRDYRGGGSAGVHAIQPDQSPWAYSVDTLSRAWLPAQDAPAEGVTPAAFITDGAPIAAADDQPGRPAGPDRVPDGRVDDGGGNRWVRALRREPNSPRAASSRRPVDAAPGSHDAGLRVSDRNRGSPKHARLSRAALQSLLAERPGRGVVSAGSRGHRRTARHRLYAWPAHDPPVARR